MCSVSRKEVSIATHAQNDIRSLARPAERWWEQLALRLPAVFAGRPLAVRAMLVFSFCMTAILLRFDLGYYCSWDDFLGAGGQAWTLASRMRRGAGGVVSCRSQASLHASFPKGDASVNFPSLGGPLMVNQSCFLWKKLRRRLVKTDVSHRTTHRQARIFEPYSWHCVYTLPPLGPTIPTSVREVAFNPSCRLCERTQRAYLL